MCKAIFKATPKQYLKQFMKKLSNIEAGLEKSVAYEKSAPPLNLPMTLQETLYLVLQNQDVVQPNLTSFKTSSYLELHQYQVVFLWVPAPCSIHPSPKRFPKRLQLLEVEIATVTLCLALEVFWYHVIIRHCLVYISRLYFSYLSATVYWSVSVFSNSMVKSNIVTP